jgi:ligand-binding sensor domain-containing protein
MKAGVPEALSRKYLVGLLFACLLYSAELVSQVPYFRPVRLAEYISNTPLNCIYQDTYGVIWLGTGNGLYRYSGKEFQMIPVTSGNQMLQVTALFMDTTNRLWVGTKSGNILFLNNDSLTNFDPEEGLPKKAITGFANDGKGNLWFSTYGEGLYYYNERHLYNLNTDDGLSDDFCYRIVPDIYGRIWAATDEGISVCIARGNIKKVDKISSSEGLPDNIVLSISPGKNGIMWIGMQDGGVCSVNINNFHVSYLPVSKDWSLGPVKDILVFNDILWLTSEKSGILELNQSGISKPINYSYCENLNFPKVNSLLADDQGNCWFITNNELVFSTGPGLKVLSEINGVPLKKIQSILYDRTGSIWFSDEGKLYRHSPWVKFAKPVQIHLPALPHTHIISLFEDSCGFIWAGTFGKGLLRVNPLTGYARLINEKDGLTNGNILSIAGRGNQIWLATLGGAYRCTLSENMELDRANLYFENFNQENGPGNSFIYTVYIDCKRRVWLGSDGKGISVFENGRFKIYDESAGLKSNVIYSITEDELGRIWFTTSKAGVYCFDGKKFKNYTVADGLSEMQISCIGSDRKNHILFVNDHGIDILDTRTGSFEYYGSEIGLDKISPDLNVLSGNGSNTFLLGTQSGMIRLEIPRDDKPHKPALQLTKVSVFLGNENFINQHEFSHNQNYLTFFFNAAWYSSPDIVTYQIKMEGYDIDWINTRDNITTYSNLPPGNYTFRIRAALKNNFRNSVIASYSFTIHKPFWKRVWFIIGVIIVMMSVILMIIRQREIRFKQREVMEREKLLFQFQTLRSQVNPHFLFNSFSTLISVIDEDKNLAIEYVSKLSQFFRNILEYRDKDLIPIKEELSLIETYTYLQKQRYGENFQLEVSLKPEHLSTLIPPLTLQMLVENAIKHNIVSPEKPLYIKIFSEDNSIIISNNLQRKKQLEASTGIGLENIRNRYSLLGLEGVNIGETLSEFTIHLPLIYP